MDQRGGLAVYVTSHGFGHLNRTVAVLNRLPIELPVTVRCHRDLFPHWEQRLLRPVHLEEYVSDLGAVSPPGDSAAVDGPATLDRASRLHAEAMSRVDEEADRLRAEGTAAVLVDVPPVPLVAASRAGIPGLALGNFLWSEIYAEHAQALGRPYLDFVDEVRRAYGHATAVFRTEPSLPLTDIARRIDVGMVVTPGRDRGAELRQTLGVGPDTKLVSFYVGRYGQDDLHWDRLTSYRNVHFVTYHAPPANPPANLSVVQVEDWNGADLAASVDAVVAKAGYGAVCEAMSSGTPFLYPPRAGFAEYRVLDQALRVWGGGVPLTTQQFAELDFAAALDRAFRLRPGSPPFYVGGASRVSEALVHVCRSGSL
jgi:hypothetical protein